MFIDPTEKEGERNIDWLPPVHTLSGDQIHNLVCILIGDRICNILVYGVMF